MRILVAIVVIFVLAAPALAHNGPEALARAGDLVIDELGLRFPTPPDATWMTRDDAGMHMRVVDSRTTRIAVSWWPARDGATDTPAAAEAWADTVMRSAPANAGEADGPMQPLALPGVVGFTRSHPVGARLVRIFTGVRDEHSIGIVVIGPPGAFDDFVAGIQLDPTAEARRKSTRESSVYQLGYALGIALPILVVVIVVARLLAGSREPATRR